MGLLVPAVLSIIFLGAFNGSQSWGDLYSVGVFGAVGWTMKQLGWPRPPLILGFVLGDTFERYLFISQELYGTSMLLRPIVIVVLAGAAYVVLRPVYNALRRIIAARGGPATASRRPHLSLNVAFTAALILFVLGAIWQSVDWPAHAQIVPLTAAGAAVLFGSATLVTELFARSGEVTDVAHMVDGPALDMTAHDTPARVLRFRAVRIFLWLVALLVAMTAVGVLPALFLGMLLLAWLEFRERWITATTLACVMTLAFWLVFDRVFATPWPDALAGDFWPWLRSTTGLV